MIEKGDLVIKRGKHEAKVYFVEDVNAESILLVNGVRDEYFEGEKDIECFHKQFRLLAKAEHLKAIKNNYPTSGYSALCEALDCAVELMSEGAEAIGKTCKWQFSGNGWGDGHWYAECGLEWELGESGTLKEHGMNYCPRCGKEIEVAE